MNECYTFARKRSICIIHAVYVRTEKHSIALYLLRGEICFANHLHCSRQMQHNKVVMYQWIYFLANHAARHGIEIQRNVESFMSSSGEAQAP
jgi:hypothetical protein